MHVREFEPHPPDPGLAPAVQDRYHEGVLRGSIVVLDPKKGVKNHALTVG